MRNSYRSVLISNLITVIIIFLLLSFFDDSGENQRNTILVLIWFAIMMVYDYLRIWLRNRKKHK